MAGAELTKEEFGRRLKRALGVIGASNVDLAQRLRELGEETVRETVSYWKNGKDMPRSPAMRRLIEKVLSLKDGYLDGLTEMSEADLTRAAERWRQEKITRRHLESASAGGPRVMLEALLRGIRGANVGAAADLIARAPGEQPGHYVLAVYRDELVSLLEKADYSLRVSVADAVAAVTTVGLNALGFLLLPGDAQGGEAGTPERSPDPSPMAPTADGPHGVTAGESRHLEDVRTDVRHSRRPRRTRKQSNGE